MTKDKKPITIGELLELLAELPTDAVVLLPSPINGGLKEATRAEVMHDKSGVYLE